MPTTSLLTLLGRVSPGAWATGIWCASTALSWRMFVGISWMPHVPAAPTASDWLVLAAATVVAIAGFELLYTRPLRALALLIAASCAVSLATPWANTTKIPLGQFTALCVVLGFVVANCPRRIWLTALAMVLAVLPGYALLRLACGLPVALEHSRGTSWNGWDPYLLTAAVGWLIGNTTRLTRAYARRLSTQAAAQAVTAERLRIAREMHDHVAHSIGIIALQAGAARRVIDTQPERAREALGEVEAAGRETLRGLRGMLGALRQADTERTDGEAPRSRPAEPRLGLGDVDRLAAATTAAGVRVHVRWRGERRALPPDVDTSAYRIIQEAVTNVVRHADTRSCRVRVDCGDDGLTIEVVDGGGGGPGGPRAAEARSGARATRRATAPRRGVPPRSRSAPHGGAVPGTGYGLLGMRERVALLHGEFSAGPRPEGGFAVVARLPIPSGCRGSGPTGTAKDTAPGVRAEAG